MTNSCPCRVYRKVPMASEKPFCSVLPPHVWRHIIVDGPLHNKQIGWSSGQLHSPSRITSSTLASRGRLESYMIRSPKRKWRGPRGSRLSNHSLVLAPLPIVSLMYGRIELRNFKIFCHPHGQLCGTLISQKDLPWSRLALTHKAQLEVGFWWLSCKYTTPYMLCSTLLVSWFQPLPPPVGKQDPSMPPWLFPCEVLGHSKWRSAWFVLFWKLFSLGAPED